MSISSSQTITTLVVSGGSDTLAFNDKILLSGTGTAFKVAVEGSVVNVLICCASTPSVPDVLNTALNDAEEISSFLLAPPPLTRLHTRLVFAMPIFLKKIVVRGDASLIVPDHLLHKSGGRVEIEAHDSASVTVPSLSIENLSVLCVSSGSVVATNKCNCFSAVFVTGNTGDVIGFHVRGILRAQIYSSGGIYITKDDRCRLDFQPYPGALGTLSDAPLSPHHQTTN